MIAADCQLQVGPITLISLFPDPFPMNNALPTIAITMGDPVGVGPEIVPKALSDKSVFRCCRPVVYGSLKRLRIGAQSIGTNLDFYAIPSIQEAYRGSDGIPVIDPGNLAGHDLAWAQPTTASGIAMADYLTTAIDDALAGRIDAIATGPINKYALKMAAIPFDGHTEILAHRTGTRSVAMMLAGNRLKVVLATIHIPLAQIAAVLRTETIAEIIALTDHSLTTRFGIQNPRIAVAGLNPHAGEGGLFGNEEKRIIQPAIDSTVRRGIAASGPHPPDTVFFTASQGAFDAVIAMYHDQGLGPFKMIHFDDGVNTTLGLPIIRTSVDHGTAYDIAGTGQASARSMLAAIFMAADQVGWQRRCRR